MRSARSRSLLAVAAIVALLVAVRALLPVALRHYANRVLDEAESYTGGVADVDLALFRGGCRIEGVKVVKENGQVAEPLFTATDVDVSLEWKALVHGAVVAEIVVDDPVVNFVQGPTRAQSQTGAEEDWVRRLEQALPISLDRVEVRNGQVHFRAPHRDPPVDVQLRELWVEARNLTNSRELSAKHPAEAEVKARVEETGRVASKLRVDPFAARPDFRLEFQLAGLDLTERELRDFLRAYAGIDAQRGKVDLDSEVVAKDGRFEGFIQPALHDVDVLDVENEAEEQGVFATIWEAIVGGTAEVLKNKPEDQLAARIPLRGSFEQPDIGVWGALVSLFRNGYVEALRPRVDLLRERGKAEG